MSMCAVIARPTLKGWLGVHVYHDGQPSGLGRILWELKRRRYQHDLSRFYSELIDSSLSGWSSLNCFHPQWATSKSLVMDWDGKATQTLSDSVVFNPEPAGRMNLNAPVSYQGDPLRGSPGLKRPPWNPRNIKGSWHKYVYVLRPEGMDLLWAPDWTEHLLLPWDVEPLWPSLDRLSPPPPPAPLIDFTKI